jgi:hypothetical protein
MNVYKILSIILSALIVVVGGFYAFERYRHSNTKAQLSNKVAKLEGTIKETETAYSKRGVIIEDLQSENEDLQNIIDDRDEEILAIGEIAFKWKDKYFKIKNVKQSVIPVSNVSEVVEIKESCVEDCETFLASNRIRVDFDHQEDPFIVKGFTLTNPPEAELKLEWTRELKLNLILTKNEDDSFRLYLDSRESDVDKIELTLNVDPAILDEKWYEKIGIGIDLGVGDGFAGGIRIYYDILDNLFIGPNVVITFDGAGARVYYGATLGFYPFK